MFRNTCEQPGRPYDMGIQAHSCLLSLLRMPQKVLLLTKQKALSGRTDALMLTGMGKELNPKFKHPFKH